MTWIDHRINFIGTKKGYRIRPLQANWHPQRDDVFLVGCMELPKRVGILLFYCLVFLKCALQFVLNRIFAICSLICSELPPGGFFIHSMVWNLQIRLLLSILLYRSLPVEILSVGSISSALKSRVIMFFLPTIVIIFQFHFFISIDHEIIWISFQQLYHIKTVFHCIKQSRIPQIYTNPYREIHSCIFEKIR